MGGGGTAPPFLTSALDGGEWSASCSRRFTSGEIPPGTHWIRGCVGPRAGLDAVEKNLALAGNRTPAIQHVARRYNDRAIWTPKIEGIERNSTRANGKNW
jgi:hypothetical protein